jgi:hypothetical protein
MYLIKKHPVPIVLAIDTLINVKSLNGLLCTWYATSMYSNVFKIISEI